MTIHERVSAANTRLVKAGIPPDSAGLDVEVLARHVLGWTRAAYLTQRHLAPHAAFTARYADLIARRERREPLSFITGVREFWGLEFEVTSDVLIPRPETELILEEALAVMPTRVGCRIVDAGTGCGCLAVALAVTIPSARIIATDISRAALAVARRNAQRHGVSHRIRWIRTDFLSGVHASADLIVSNPPYVPAEDMPQLQPEVRDYEPMIALNGGIDGTDGLRALTIQAAASLSHAGSLVVEFGVGQEAALRRLVSAQPTLSVSKIRRDLQGFPRVAVLRSVR